MKTTLPLRINLLITRVSMQLIAFNCARQDGNVAGVDNPADKGVRVAASQSEHRALVFLLPTPAV